MCQVLWKRHLIIVSQYFCTSSLINVCMSVKGLYILYSLIFFNNKYTCTCFCIEVSFIIRNLLQKYFVNKTNHRDLVKWSLLPDLSGWLELGSWVSCKSSGVEFWKHLLLLLLLLLSVWIEKICLKLWRITASIKSNFNVTRGHVISNSGGRWRCV